MNLNISEILTCINSLANPIAARPESLRVTDPGSLPGWFKDNPKYKGWLENNLPKLLWVVGKPGKFMTIFMYKGHWLIHLQAAGSLPLRIKLEPLWLRQSMASSLMPSKATCPLRSEAEPV